MTAMFELVGIPYTKGGKSPEEGFDCYGLLQYIYRMELGIVLPDNPMGWRRFGKTADFDPDQIRSYDVLFFNDDGLGIVTHLGIAASQVDFVHALESARGVVCEPILKYADKVRKIGIPNARCPDDH